jgi:hypothetical protein
MSEYDQNRIMAFIIAVLISYIISQWISSIAPTTLDPNLKFVAQIASFFLSLLIFYEKVRLHITVRKDF